MGVDTGGGLFVYKGVDFSKKSREGGLGRLFYCWPGVRCGFKGEFSI